MPPPHVYVHVPFCRRRCSYCDFAIAVRRTVPVHDYVRAIAAEVETRFPGNDEWNVDTLYLGGGTPSLLGPDGVARLMDALGARLRPTRDPEVTLEANPEDVTATSARAWRSAGVDRLSLGAQSFHDPALAWMHRTHDAARIVSAADAARDAGFDELSLDLIFALPQHLDRDWERDLSSALALAPTHVSLYGLTIEPATPLGRWHARGVVSEAPEEQYEQEYLLAHELLAAAGFEHYEVSNFARPGHRARHNSAYWRHVPYAGLGPAAHGFDGARRRWNAVAFTEWARRVLSGRDPVDGEEVLTEDELADERTYLGLRTDRGIALDDRTAAACARWVQAGWATSDGARLTLTPSGWLRLDALATDLTSIPSRL